MTYNPRIQNIENNIIDISGNVNIITSDSYISGNIVNVSSLTLASLISGNYIALTSSDLNLSIIRRRVKTITGSIDINSADDESIIFVDPRSDIDIKLPLSISSSGEEYVIKRINDSSNKINIIPFGDISWKEQQYFLAPLTGAFLVDLNRFGSAIESNGAGNVIVVGSPYRTINFVNQGAAFVYRSGTTGWKLEATLYTSSTDLNQNLTNTYTAEKVSINNAGNLILLSSRTYENDSYGNGLIFRSSSTGWKFEQSVLPQYLDGTANTELGIFENVVFNSTGNYFISPGNKDFSLFGYRTYAHGRIFRSSSAGWYLEDILTSSLGIVAPRSGDINGAGNIAIIGSPSADPGGKSNGGTINIYRSSSAGWQEQTRLTGATNDNLGGAVLLNEAGNMIFGTMYVNYNTLESGMAVFRSSSSGWRRESILTGTNSNYAFDSTKINYAGSIAITRVYDTGNNVTGSFAVFRSSSVGWRQDSPLVTSSIHSYSQDGPDFLIDMDSAGNTLIVGSPGSDIPFANNGAFMVFQNTAGATWKEEAFVTGPVDQYLPENISFGASLDINGDGTAIIVGSPYSNYSSSNGTVTSSVGSCVVCRSSSNGWKQEAYITSSTLMNNGANTNSTLYFGDAVAINKLGNKFAAAAPSAYASTTASYPGCISIWNSSSIGWREEAILTTKSASINSFICANDNISRIAAGMTSFSSSAGAVVIFNSSSAGWIEETYLTSSGDGNPSGDSLGRFVALNGAGNILAAGTTGYDIPYSNVGGIIVFRSSSTGWKQEEILKTTSNLTSYPLGLYISINQQGDVIAATNGTGINIYKSSSVGWYTDKSFLTPSIYSGDYFTSIDINLKGNIIVAGQSRYGSYFEGKLYVFRSSSVFGWEELYNLTSSENGGNKEYAYFGSTVAINNSGSIIVGSSAGIDLISGNYTSSDAGSITIFSYSSSHALLQDSSSKNNYLNNPNIFYDKIDKTTKLELSSPYESVRIISDGSGSWSII